LVQRAQQTLAAVAVAADVQVLQSLLMAEEAAVQVLQLFATLVHKKVQAGR
jgi:hypothetical protein